MATVTAEFSISGADELIDRYIAGELVAEGLLMEGMERSLNYGALNAAFYPPESEANQPPPPYYIRGVGTQYATSNRNESEQLDQSWEKQISKEDKGIIGTLEPQASYARYLHGLISQHQLNNSRGWRDVSRIAEDITPIVQDIFADVARKFAAFLSGGI